MFYDVLAINTFTTVPTFYHHYNLNRSELQDVKSQPNLTVIVVNKSRAKASHSMHGTPRSARLWRAQETWIKEQREH